MSRRQRTIGFRMATWLPLLQRGKPWLLAAGILVLAGLLTLAFKGLWQEISYDQVVAAVRGVDRINLALALLATAMSYLALSGYDHSSLRYVGVSVPYRLVAQTSFIAYALTNTIGLGVFTGGAVRMRLYGSAGVEAALISRAIAFNAVAFGLGVSTVGAVGLLWDARELASLMRVPAWLLSASACLVLAAIGALLVWCRDGRERRLFGRWPVRLPPASLALRQLLWSVLDILAAGAVLWVLLPDGAVGFPSFIGFYAAALVLGVISHVPGGLGVFEAVMLVALGGRVPGEALAGALVLYRLIYYVLPLVLALLLMLLHELRNGVVAPLTRAIGSLAPLLLAAYTLVVAVVVLLSGVTPASEEAMALLALHVPLSLVEASHFLSSVAGLALLFVARGMLSRLDAAWWAGLGLALMSLLMALPKGIAIGEAILLVSLATALAVSHKQFKRKASLFSVAFTAGWWLAIGGILAALTALLFFAYQGVDYTHDLWWQFEFDGDAPRSLRALVGVALLALILAVRQLLRPASSAWQPPDASALARAERIIRQQDNADGLLALTGDKQFLFSDSGNALVMFGRQRRSWISLFDPIGPEQEQTELVWRFVECAREAGGRACFYQVRSQSLSMYLDAGLRLFKLGEYAYVPLADFSLEGKQRSGLRYSVKRAEREGAHFEMVPVEGVPAILGELRAISDAWLGEHRAAEKRFSVGAFIDGYLLKQPVGLVRHEGRIVAFATVLTTDIKAEASVDLMRHLPEMPYGTMDFLFAELMLHFRGLGFQRFGLGMAPLSGMARHPLAPFWHRGGRLLFSHGENFYNFRGLRAFKEKFDPRWEARYLASPGGFAPLLLLADIAALISGGLKGVVTK
jgi:phosphatidylglycerol lysyltransferase